MLDESIFKAYDIRGAYPESLDESVARDIGRAFVAHLDLSGSRVVVARDMRLSGEALEKAFIQGVTEAGTDVLDLGLVSTDALYFAVGHLEEPGGAMVTASHNPKDYNGFKLCREEAIALSGDAGLGEIRDAIVSGELPDPAEYPGSVEETDITEDYAKHCLGFIDTEGLRPLKIVIEATAWLARWSRPSSSISPSSTSRCTSSSTAPSPTIRQTPSSPRTLASSRSAWSPRRPTSGWPSTATQTGALSSTRTVRSSLATWPPPS